jgi:hypothetical protein
LTKPHFFKWDVGFLEEIHDGIDLQVAADLVDHSEVPPPGLELFEIDDPDLAFEAIKEFGSTREIEFNLGICGFDIIPSPVELDNIFFRRSGITNTDFIFYIQVIS